MASDCGRANVLCDLRHRIPHHHLRHQLHRLHPLAPGWRGVQRALDRCLSPFPTKFMTRFLIFLSFAENWNLVLNLLSPLLSIYPFSFLPLLFSFTLYFLIDNNKLFFLLSLSPYHPTSPVSPITVYTSNFPIFHSNLPLVSRLMPWYSTIFYW